MRETTFTTEELPAGERFEGWYELASRVLIPTHVRRDDTTEFQASTLVRGSRALQLATGTVGAFSAERTEKLIRRSDPERYLLDVVRTGTGLVCQGSQEAYLNAGDLVLTDSSQPCRARHETGIHESLVVPKALLPFTAAQLAPLLARRLDGDTGIGAVLSRCLYELARPRTPARAADIERLLDPALELLTTLLAHELDSQGTLTPKSQQQALLARITSFVHQHLGDPGLCPRTVAHAHHISLRRLQQVLATSGLTPAALIRTERLHQCQRALTDPAQTDRTIQSIATRWGFTNHAHFTRLFRATYGMPPGEYRAAHGGLGRPRE
ncbi:helix-turn-helix domain-containing protein [Streptomyces spectabilis]|uniref:AraC-like DNA-binding protein n=1 Tax=Streptomyces spectabilis TaxID=68270 RepID=A0A7W8B1F2_STRST|nr:helix-turn-helix domain-containing protein [Streptomyces spectabilis]MBB5106928.1 AraC-like DNA-binding protein [Streptomyces spectabilis]MCI3906342.1 helix-turn-helix domain-containing protein [Streptomyces spectabilis]GGV41281.1 AraC family transcriptional regulator [Streptomyces spectabilis]